MNTDDISVYELAQLFARSADDGIEAFLIARVVKAQAGKGPLTNRSLSFDGRDSDCVDIVLSWVKRKRCDVVWRTKSNSGCSQTAIISFPKGFMSIGISPYRRGGIRAYRRRKIVKRKQLPGVDIHISLFGSEVWTSKIATELSELLADKRVIAAPSKRVERKLHVLRFTKRGFGLKAIVEFQDELERGNYTPQVQSQFDRAVTQLSSEDPIGRLLVMYGPPGTGKTYMVRALINAIKRTQCVLVPSQIVPQVSNPALGNFMMGRRRPICLVIEDADELLITRGADNITAINSMLNMADGIFGQVADVRLVCTTNAKKLEIDPALLRSGRLLDQIHVDGLQPEHAVKVYERLTGTAPDPARFKRATLADVYKAAREEGGKD